MQKKNVVILGGGTGLSNIVKGLKSLPIKITAVVTVSDNGSSTGKLRKEFSIPAVGDIRKVLTHLSTLPKDIQNFMEYRLKSKSDLNGHAIGNLLLTCLLEETKSLKKSIKEISKLLHVKHTVLPLSEDYLTLCGKATDGEIIEGEEEITKADKKYERIFYKEEPHICPEILTAIENADLIILSAGSLLTSLLPNITCKDISTAINNSKAKVMYICNAFTQPGESDGYTVNDHVNVINSYFSSPAVDVVVANKGSYDSQYIEKYRNEEQKELVKIDHENINKSGYQLIEADLLTDEDGTLKHDSLKLSAIVFSYLMQL
ncbi:MAG: YvcK family protein [Clostridiales bacterium]|nr:YvcK family protein [Clostridiales bacterium]